MDRDLSSAGADRGLLVEAGVCSSDVGHMALEREKQELRRERDHLLLDLAADLGPVEVARRFGVEPPVIATLLDGARGRLSSALGERASRPAEISARRLRAGEPRWGAADAHYESLGRAAGHP